MATIPQPMVPHRSTPRRIMARWMLVMTRAIAQPTELPLDQPHAAAVATVLHAAPQTALALMRVLPLAHQGVTALVRSLIAPINAIALDTEMSLEIQIAAAVATLPHAATQTALALMRVLPLAHQGVTALVRSLIAPINAIALDTEMSLETQIAAAVATLPHAAPQTALALMRVLPLAHQGVAALVRSLIAPINAIALDTEMSLWKI
jgi:hypothetical protein